VDAVRLESRISVTCCGTGYIRMSVTRVKKAPYILDVLRFVVGYAGEASAELGCMSGVSDVGAIWLIG
jgi:hypothetical protein